jgi:two-component system, cell cycle sensor histidine kinase and response regulator CckA
MREEHQTGEQLIQTPIAQQQRIEECERTIAECRKAETTLREKEKFIHSLVEHMLDGMVICDWDGRILFANNSAARIVGLESLQDGIGRKVTDFFNSESENCLFQDLFLVREGKGGFLREYRLKTLSGKDLWVEAIGNRIHYNGGFADLVTFRDVSERKRAESALRDSEKRYRAIFETTGTAMLVVEEDATISLVNREIEKLSGYPREDIEGKKKWFEMIVKDDLDKMIEYHKLRRIDPESAPRSYEARLVHKNGEIRTIWMTVDLIPGTKQSVASLLDITDPKRMENALLESEGKYRNLIENANEGIFIAQDGFIKFPNPRTLQVLGYTETELAEIPFTKLIHPDDRDVATDRYLRRLKGEELPSPYAYRVITKTGEEIWVLLNSAALTWEGRPATINFVTDITQEKRLEKQFQAAQKMEAVGTLAGGIAHNFNNLLMGVQGHVALALFDMKPGDPHYEDLKAIEEQVKSGANLTTQLLGFARKGKYEVRPVDLNEVIYKSSGLFEKTQKGIRVHRNFQRDLWTSEVDKGQIEQLLLNLYINAWQAMPGGGDLFLSTENITLDLTYQKPFYVKPGNYVKISVRDTGVGIEKEIQQRIFEPFFTTKGMGRGSGLGLASVYGIVKNHGGHITVYSEPGHGAAFNLYMPASEKKVVVEKTTTSGPFQGTETVLLVDDEETIITVVEKGLKMTGYRSLVARSGEEAVQIYRQNQERIALVVLDMIMPGMSGGKVYDELKRINPKVKAILSSGYSLDEEASEIMARGCNVFIQKPFGIMDLSQKIREVLDENNSRISKPS